MHYSPRLFLAYGQDIFGNWVVETTYGRIGGKGRTLVTVVDNEEEALQYVQKSLKRRQSALLIRPYEGLTPFGLSQSKPLDELAFRQAQGERLQTFKGRINKAYRRRLQGSYNPRFGARVDTPAMLKGSIASPTIGVIRTHRYSILCGYRRTQRTGI